MGKGKLRKFAETETFDNVIQPPFEEIFKKDYFLKKKWNSVIFKNNNPIVLELGCGKGEYTLGLARRFPEKNFIGIDIKGARIWKGAKEAILGNLNNVAFLRTRIEFISSFFGNNEISEIWITFPDPQIKKRRNKKRLTAPRFLSYYKEFLKDDGIIHLKTDSIEMHEYTLAVVDINNLEKIICTDDLYNSSINNDILNIRTFYEQIFLNEGKKITYLKFKLNNSIPLKDIPDEE